MKSELPPILKGVAIPRHIAIIMDGNGRWAGSHRLTRFGGHRRGAEAVRTIVKACREIGVQYLTLYAFSEENWQRPKDEVTALMKILKRFLVSERRLLQENDIRMRAIGNLSRLPQNVRKTLNETMSLTRGNQSMSLVLALSYGGRDEITRAVQAIAQKITSRELSSEMITAQTISDHLDTAEFPDPDLLIRTSGELRTSNFLPWQTIYTELYVTPTLWPDFGREKLYEAISSFHTRERRFGLTSEQLNTEAKWLAQ